MIVFLGFLCPPTPDKKFTLVQCEIVAIDNEVKDLLFDLQVITDMAKVALAFNMTFLVT